MKTSTSCLKSRDKANGQSIFVKNQSRVTLHSGVYRQICKRYTQNKMKLIEQRKELYFVAMWLHKGNTKKINKEGSINGILVLLRAI